MAAEGYESTGRTSQKQRTRDLLVRTVRDLIGQGRDPTVDEVAAASGVSRTTTYRYFPSQQAMVLAAFPETEGVAFGPSVTDVRERLATALEHQFRVLREWEPQLRAALRASLAPAAGGRLLRGGRAIGWFEDALAPIGATHDVHALAISLRAVAGIEPYVWLTDVAGQSPDAAVATMRRTAMTLLDAALAANP
ncbi:MAG TPA: TetR family transcriptional regulator [Marmoricola sp.]|nr:TetR family transcriptional regulator [Marmoricola sp.]